MFSLIFQDFLIEKLKILLLNVKLSLYGVLITLPKKEIISNLSIDIIFFLSLMTQYELTSAHVT